MQTIPEAILRLLKKRSMVGNDAPKATLTFTDPAPDLTIQPASIRISRDSASLSARLTASWPNVNPDNPLDPGYYSPDRGDDIPGDLNDYYQVVMPGANVTASLGYGNLVAQVFKGQLDDVELVTEPDGYSVAVDGRDDGWKLLDQTVETAGTYELSYTAQTVEYIVDALLQAAGFAAGDITTEATGISATVTFTRESYADALGWCEEVSGFELVIDYQGKASFRYPTDRQPAITDLAVVLTGTTAMTITGGTSQGKAPIVTDSEIVTANTLTTDTPTLTGTAAVALSTGVGSGLETVLNTAETVTYTRGTDYTMNYTVVPATIARIAGGAITDGQQVKVKYYAFFLQNTDYTITYGSEGTEATLVRIAGGAITSGQTVLIDYVYAAWVFRQGVDLFRLPYRITRRNVYGRIIVIGQDATGAEVSGTYTYPSRATFGIPDDKILFVNIPELDTNTKCLAAATQMGNDMVRRVREINFAAVAVPWLQVGDVVQVIESSTTISESYRITALDLQLDEGGFIMTATAYFYGYAPL